VHFLEPNEIEEWCANHGAVLGDNGRPVIDASLAHHARITYAKGRRSGHEASVAESSFRAIGAFDECLLWVTGWGIWPSSEDWPRYYAARGARGERRSLSKSPGHLFESTESLELAEFLTLVLENAWDAFLLQLTRGGSAKVRVRVSHDEWIEVYGTESIELNTPV